MRKPPMKPVALTAMAVLVIIPTLLACSGCSSPDSENTVPAAAKVTNGVVAVDETPSFRNLGKRGESTV